MIIIDTRAGTIVIVQGCQEDSTTYPDIDTLGIEDLEELTEGKHAEHIECPIAFDASRLHTTTLTNGRERPPVKASGYG